MLYLTLLPHLYLAECILDRFTVRVHSRIVEKGRAWVRLWYLIRALDFNGAGYASIPLSEICEILDAAESTVYQWLREGVEAGAFRHYKVREGILTGHLGGMMAVCKRLGLERPGKGIPPWGTTFEIPLHEICSLLGKIRAAATAATTQRLQQLSRFAAWRNLPPAARKTYRLPQPDAFFNDEDQHRLSRDSASGSIRCCIHISQHRVWVSKGFVPFGISQNAIAQERNVSDRTVRRHLKQAGVKSRQVVQTKAAYRQVVKGLEWDINTAPEPDISLRWIRDRGSLLYEGSYTLTEPAGRVGNPHTFEVSRDRFFKYGDHVYIYRTNLYKPSLQLSTMSAARRKYSVLQKGRNFGRGPCSIGGLNESAAEFKKLKSRQK